MGKEARTILNKKFAMTLIEKNYKLNDVQPSIKLPGEIAFIFEKSEAFEEEYNILVNSERVLKNMYGLTLHDIRTIIGVLQGYKIEDNERFPIMEKLQVVRNILDGDYDNHEKRVLASRLEHCRLICKFLESIQYDSIAEKNKGLISQVLDCLEY
jgi:hypothetical protein